MMSRLAEYMAAERALAIYARELEEMKQDPELKREIEFNSALDELLVKFKFSRQTLFDILALEVKTEKKAAPGKGYVKKTDRKSPNFKARTYVNPHSGKEITIRLGTDSTYKAWVGQYGKETVATWLTHTSD